MFNWILHFSDFFEIVEDSSKFRRCTFVTDRVIANCDLNQTFAYNGSRNIQILYFLPVKDDILILIFKQHSTVK